MQGSRIRLCALAALCAVPPLAEARPAAAQLAGGGEAGFHVSIETAYRGRKMVIDFSHLTPQMTTLTVVRQSGGRERREFLAGNAVLVGDGTTIWQYFPDRRLVVKRRAPGAEAAEMLRPEDLRVAAAGYEVRYGPPGTVAGRRSLAFEFCPRQPGSRPLRKIWVDESTGLILRTEIYSAENRLSWLSVFETLDYHPAADPELFTMRVPPGVRVQEAEEERCLGAEEASRQSGLPVGLPHYLPDGFGMKCIRARRLRDYGEVQVLYSDGLSLLSLFQSTSFHPPGPQAEGREAEEAVGAWPGRWYDMGLVRAVAWRPPWAHLVLLGELSREELLKVARSVAGPVEPSGGNPHQ